MPNKLKLTGLKFTKLTALESVGKNKHGQYMWKCVCDCGNIKIVGGSRLVSKNTQSCGCLPSAVVKTHGMSKTKIWNTWIGIIQRCTDKKCTAYENYGGRGIKVCDRWKNSFENFYEDMGNVVPGLSVDRIDNNGDYCKENCRWATPKQQARNTRKNIKYGFEGKKRTIKEISEITGVKDTNIYQRINKLGWTLNRAFRKK